MGVGGSGAGAAAVTVPTALTEPSTQPSRERRDIHLMLEARVRDAAPAKTEAGYAGGRCSVPGVSRVLRTRVVCLRQTELM